MSAQSDYCMSEEDIKTKYPDLHKIFESNGVSTKAANILIKDEDITSVAALKHLKDETINKLKISDTQKEILKSVVKELKKPSEAGEGGIEATGNSITVADLQGQASLVHTDGAAGGGRVNLEENRLRAGRVGEKGILTAVKRDNDDKK